MYKPGKFFLLIVLLLPLSVQSQNVKRDSFYVANWNLENLFDTEDDTTKNDNEFLPESAKQWTIDKLEQKVSNLAKVINYMNHGCGPDILTMEEVENINVLKMLVYKLPDRNYAICHRDSPDRRGIDVGLFYDRNIFDIDSLVAIHVELEDHNPTRDILHVILKHKRSGEKIHVFANHWPSRLGGQEKSNSKRAIAAEVLKSNLDRINKSTPHSKIIIAGDFNDNPNDESIVNVLGAKDFECDTQTNSKANLLDLAAIPFSKGEGSYLYNSKFEMIDQIIISASLVGSKNIFYKCNSFEVIKPPFMIIQSGKRAGGALPTFLGKIYSGGYSDHFPVGARFYWQEK